MIEQLGVSNLRVRALHTEGSSAPTPTPRAKRPPIEPPPRSSHLGVVAAASLRLVRPFPPAPSSSAVCESGESGPLSEGDAATLLLQRRRGLAACCSIVGRAGYSNSK